MFDFNKIYSEPINRDFVLSRLSDTQIFYQYFGPYKLGDVYSSKFRRDKSPSTGFYVGKTGKLIYNDLKTGEKLDCFAFVSKLYNISYGEAIRKIAADFGLIGDSKLADIHSDVYTIGAEIDKEAKKQTLIQFVPDKWNDKNLLFWREFEITREELIKEEVYPIKELFINKCKIYNKENYNRYAYVNSYEGIDYVKIYSPKDPRMKWVSNIPLSIPFGLNDLHEDGEILIITKSKKDLIVLKKLFNNVIATQNESESSLPSDIIEKYLKRFPQKYIFWDNDETGVENCKKFNEKGFGYFNIPKSYYDRFKIKDASDYVAYYGIDALAELFKEKNIL